MIRRLWKTLKLGFDRSFSGASWKQITWLFGILALVLGFWKLLSEGRPQTSSARSSSPED